MYETSQTVQSGLNRMKKWLAQALVFYPKAVQTIREHLEGICNYFISHTTSGVMEGINNKVKLIMRQGYGFTDFENFRARLLASFSD
ncbi:transposase [Allocoleopsis sp.]|uniref:transposase n=1 Tax=Allocoleopsis sp. TaxID=3088169 RepID=UPI0032C20FD2